jgi:DNA-directed RNA polymerase I subunit RPA43
MNKPKNHYIKYKRAELESYVQDPESCVQRITVVERLRFAPNIISNFKQSIMQILSRKIGKYDMKLEGVVLDFRNTKILNMQSCILSDAPQSLIKIETNFYVFSPRKDAIVDGIVKHINRQSMETIISVVIYRVFNVKVTLKGSIKNNQVHNNQEIKIRLKAFHFDHELPFIEGELVHSNNLNSRKYFDDVADSGISETTSEHQIEIENDESEKSLNIRIKQERDSSLEPSTSQKTTATNNNRNNRKRKSASNQDESIVEPVPKKIKQEPPSDEDKKVLSEDVNDSNKKSKSKKKKKKKCSLDEDFESSLQMLINSSSA